jgi:hypothetical protein
MAAVLKNDAAFNIAFREDIGSSVNSDNRVGGRWGRESKKVAVAASGDAVGTTALNDWNE